MITIATPTKTLRFSPEVLEVLRSKVTWGAGGLSVTMPQLDRGLYEQVSKAFNLMGGKWNKKANATLFPSDPRGQVEGLIESGKLVVEKDGFFPTPPEVTRLVLKQMGPWAKEDTWLEPEAGDGAMVKVLLEEGVLPDHIYCIEKNPERCKLLRKLGVHVGNGDFLAFRNRAGIRFTRIIMNPPFEKSEGKYQDIHHITQAFDFLEEGGVMGAVMGAGATFREDDTSKAFRDWLRSVNSAPRKLPEGSFKESGTLVNTCYVVIRK